MSLGDFVMLDAPSEGLQQVLQGEERIFINLGFSNIQSVGWPTYLSQNIGLQIQKKKAH